MLNKYFLLLPRFNTSLALTLYFELLKHKVAISALSVTFILVVWLSGIFYLQSMGHGGRQRHHILHSLQPHRGWALWHGTVCCDEILPQRIYWICFVHSQAAGWWMLRVISSTRMSGFVWTTRLPTAPSTDEICWSLTWFNTDKDHETLTRSSFFKCSL